MQKSKDKEILKTANKNRQINHKASKFRIIAYFPRATIEARNNGNSFFNFRFF